MTRLYKILDGDKSTNGGSYTWGLPVKNDDGSWTPGEWTEPVEGKLKACKNGYHFADESQLIRWLGPDIYEAEAEEAFNDGEKWVGRRSRLLRKVEAWNDKTARLFAVWCAREALKLIDKPDPRSVAACDVAERYANGEATREELAAAWDAAWDAARAAARDAAKSAAWDATKSAAWAAAWDAARAAARDAAKSAARDAQTKRLMEMLGE